MKSKYVILASALLISVTAFAQKDQIKAAEKALKAGNAAEAVSILQAAASASSAAPDAEKAHYFFVNGNAHLELANKKVDEGKNLSLAAKSYQDLLAVEKASGKDKYSSGATNSISTIKEKLLTIVQNKIDKKEFAEAVKYLIVIYDLDKTDLEKLYYAANYAIEAKDYDSALKFYQELKSKNYSGAATNYYAKSAISEKEEFFGSNPNAKKDRDEKVKLKLYTNPRDEKVLSKNSEIRRNIALILIQMGKIEEAKTAISDARKANPEDTSLILTEADLYLETKDFETYKKLINEVLDKNPNDADLIFSLGLSSQKANNPVEAEKYYKRVLEINPNYTNAYLNLSILMLDPDKEIGEEMNKLGTTAKDMKRFEELKTKRINLYKTLIPIYQKASETDPKNVEIYKSLLSVYHALEMDTEYKELNEKIKELEQK